MVDVFEIVFDAFLDLFAGIGFTAPAIDLRPAGNAGPHPVAGKITIDDLLVEGFRGLGLGGVRAGANQRQLAFQHVKQLRQLIERRLADEPANAGDARIVPAHQF